MEAESQGKKRAEPTADRHYVVIDGSRWHVTNPNLTEDMRRQLVHELMGARRAVGAALGERGPKWWEKPEPPQDQ